MTQSQPNPRPSDPGANPLFPLSPQAVRALLASAPIPQATQPRPLSNPQDWQPAAQGPEQALTGFLNCPS